MSDAPAALVQEADCAERVIVLKTRHPGTTSFVVVAATKTAGSGAGLLAKDARQGIWGARLPPGSGRQRAREDALEGARVHAVTDEEVIVEQEGDLRTIRVDRGRVVVTDVTDRAAALAHPRFVEASDASLSIAKPLPDHVKTPDFVGRVLPTNLQRALTGGMNPDDLMRAVEQTFHS